jgi:hypothetical protein
VYDAEEKELVGVSLHQSDTQHSVARKIKWTGRLFFYQLRRPFVARWGVKVPKIRFQKLNRPLLRDEWDWAAAGSKKCCAQHFMPLHHRFNGQPQCRSVQSAA